MVMLSYGLPPPVMPPPIPVPPDIAPPPLDVIAPPPPPLDNMVPPLLDVPPEMSCRLEPPVFKKSFL